MSRKILISLLCLCFGVATVLPVIVVADTAQVTLTYNIPTVTTFSVSYPTGETSIVFEPTGATFTNQPAKGQGASTAALNITNTGNTNIKINATLSTDLPTGVTEFRLNTTNDYNQGWYWTNANETTNQTIVSSLASSAYQNFWAWTTGSNVPAGTYTATKLNLYSSAV